MKVLINHEIAKEFSSVTGIETIPLFPYNRLDLPVQCHADMLFCVLDDTIFCYEDYVKEYGLLSCLTEGGKKICFVSATCESKYPKDISLNVLVMGKTIFCNVRHTAREILCYAESNGYKIVNVKQGYAACSTLVVDDNFAVTADKGMIDAIKAEGKECLLADCDDIVLEGYKCGFFGGASGVIDKNIYFFGDVDMLKNGEKIRTVLNDKNYDVFQITSGRVYDFGGIKVI